MKQDYAFLFRDNSLNSNKKHHSHQKVTKFLHRDNFVPLLLLPIQIRGHKRNGKKCRFLRIVFQATVSKKVTGRWDQYGGD